MVNGHFGESMVLVARPVKVVIARDIDIVQIQNPKTVVLTVRETVMKPNLAEEMLIAL